MVEPILLIAESWWWVAPAAAGAAAATYTAFTTRGRRARRLELDAARHEEAVAQRALQSARARVRDAQADMLSARAESGQALLAVTLIGTPATNDARRRLQDAKRAERSAALELQASRARVKSTSAQYHTASAGSPLPIEKLFAAHDAVVVRWMAYETDADKAISYPAMSDARQPATLAFLMAQRDAQQLRPASARERIPPAQFVSYRSAVRTLEAAFVEAERQAGVIEARPPLPRAGFWPVPGMRSPRPPTPTEP